MRAISLAAWSLAAGIAALLASVRTARAQGGASAKPGGGTSPAGSTKPAVAPPSAAGWPNDLKARAAKILAAVEAGTADHAWAPVALSAGGHTGEIMVSADDLRVDGVRVSVDARTLEQIAALLGGVLATSRVADLVYQQAERTMPYLATTWWQAPSTMETTPRMLEYSAMVDAKIGEGRTLAANTGKWWVQSIRLRGQPSTQAANYGWHTGQGNSVVQSVGIKHDDTHVDYSQKARIMSDTMRVDGQIMITQDVLADPVLSALLSSEGAL